MPKFARGARPSPRHKLASADPFRPAQGLLAPPTQFSVIPSQLSYWLNNQDGDCVTAEEAFAKAAYSVMSGLPELFIPDAEVQAWASAGGYLNGANLTDVMDSMAQKGFLVAGVLYGDGPYQSVDWTNAAVLQAAIAQGPVKIGVASSQFESIPGVGDGSGWFMTGFRQEPESAEDHCVTLCGYGPMSYLFGLFGKLVPAGVSPTDPGYLLFTWSGIGVIDVHSMLAVTFEAWLRLPTTPGEAPAPNPAPGPTPTPGPTPVPVPVTTLTGTTAPYSGTIQVPTGLLGGRTETVPFSIPALPVTVALPTPTPAEGAEAEGLALINFLRRGHLLAELTAAGMPGAAAAVGAADWTTILNWIVTNAPAILALVTQLIALFGGA